MFSGIASLGEPLPSSNRVLCLQMEGVKAVQQVTKATGKREGDELNYALQSAA